MLQKKLLTLMLAVLLLIVADFAAIRGFYYLCAFPIPAGDEIAHLGTEYAGATVLSSCDIEHDYFRYLLVEMPSGEMRVLALQESHNFKGRYRFVPDDVLYVSEERPFTERLRAGTGSASIWVMEDNSIRAFNVFYNYLGSVENYTQLLLYALMAAEFAIWLIVVRLRNGPIPRLPAEYSAALQEAGTPPPVLDRHSLRSGPGHPAQRTPLKRVLKPIPPLLLLAATGAAAIYFVFQTFIFTIQFDGNLASLGPEYENAVVLFSDVEYFEPEQSRHIYLIRTASGETQMLFLRNVAFHQGRYLLDSVRIPEERPYSFPYSGLGLKTAVEILSDSEVHFDSGPLAVTADGPSKLENLEFLLYFGWLVLIWALAVYISHRIKPLEKDDPAVGQTENR